jgi:Arc/MetJ-type ribon-helix-helix transcriptional regulator
MKTEILNVRLSSEMVAWLDSLIEKGIYKSRGESIRDLLRDYVESGGEKP